MSGVESCPSCGATFTCGIGHGTCWCMDLPPLKEADLTEDCLCPTCLRERIAQQEDERVQSALANE